MIKWVAMNKVVVPMTTDVTGMMIAVVAMTVDVLGTKMMLTIWRMLWNIAQEVLLRSTKGLENLKIVKSAERERERVCMVLKKLSGSLDNTLFCA
jgi:hypothetical protein